MFDNLLIEDSSEYTGTFIDLDNMQVTSAIEAFNGIDVNAEDYDEMLSISTESVIAAIETDLEAITAELEIASEGFKDKVSSAGGAIANGAGKVAQGAKNALANVVEAIKEMCIKHSKSLESKGDQIGAKKWMARYKRCLVFERKLRGNISEEGLARLKNEIESLKDEIKNLKEVKKKMGKSEESYTILIKDHDAGYEVAVEGLFSKPKTGEQLMTQMQKKVGKLKTVEACDSMLQQLESEAAKFNSAIGSLKSASSAYAENNDKKALRKSAGPVLKELNKTCKLLKIKSISGDPKNISQEEITKLHDFITGAKQLINAKKKQLAGGATESMSYTDDMLGLMQDDFDDEIETADEALIEDFDVADIHIAIATEGIIDPDMKRAHRIKFGEKKRSIQSIVKKARQAKKAKDFAAAISLYQEAKKGYQGLLSEAKKIQDRATGSANKTYGKSPSAAKTSLINWCIKKMGECDNAIEAIRNGQMKSERKAAAKESKEAKKAAKKGEGASESYLDDVNEYEAVIEALTSSDDDYEDENNNIDDVIADLDEEDPDELETGIESLTI